MSKRITRENLNTQIDTINGILERRRLATRYGLEIWSPGDGWTRYQLIHSQTHREASRVCTLGEMYDVLYTLIRVLESI